MNDAPLELPSPGDTAASVISGPVGRLEALLASPTEGRPKGVCVVSHPHPLYGGTMTNKVVWTLANAALKAGLAVARFNFRGVGASEGSYANAEGETDDLLAVAAVLRECLPGLPLLLAGFSFGAYVSIKAAAVAKPKALVTIAPPFGRYMDASEAPAHPHCPWLAVHSRDDDTVAFEDTRAVLEAYDPPPELLRFESAGHFFHGQLGPLQAAVQPFIERHF
ncbi:MAG: Dot/Icm type IV secretion system effector CoxH3 [Nevskia sp.]